MLFNTRLWIEAKPPASGKAKHGFPLFVREVVLLEISVNRYVIMAMNNGPKTLLGI